jgi:hypothetical protein
MDSGMLQVIGPKDMRYALILILLATPALATGEAEWDAFQAEVAAACLALPDAPQNAAVEVSPFGSATYGAALVTSITDGVIEQQVCIFDKATRTAELASPFMPGQ